MDREKVCTHLSEMIRIPTISSFEQETENEDVFDMFMKYLEKTYPHLYKTAPPEYIGRRGLLFHLKGQDERSAAVLMAHYDVVDVDPDQWTEEPFSGRIDEKRIYGRGALDTKCTFCAILETVEEHLAKGNIFLRNVYLSFSGEEEVEGESSAMIAAVLKERGISPYMVLDEGGAVIPEGVPGMAKESAMIGVAEKGLVNVRLSLKGDSGHASVPPRHPLTGRLAKAVTAIEKHPFKGQITPATEAMFRYIGRARGGAVGLAFRSIRLLRPMVILLASRMGGTFNAMVRSTAVVTMLKGAESYPILPSEVSAGVNVRLLGRDTMDSAVRHLERVIKDPAVKVEIVNGSDPSPISRSEGESWNLLTEVIGEVWPGDLCVPYTMNGATDSRHYHSICSSVYKFTPLVMNKEERGSVHGVNEQIRIDEWMKMLLFYEKLLKRL